MPFSLFISPFSQLTMAAPHTKQKEKNQAFELQSFPPREPPGSPHGKRIPNIFKTRELPPKTKVKTPIYTKNKETLILSPLTR